MRLGNPLHDLRSLTQTLPITLLLLTALLLSACQQPLDQLAGTIPATEVDATATIEQESAAAMTPVEAIDPLPPEEAAEPVQLTLPALDLTLPVTPMGWTVVTTDAGLTTEWEVPDASLGWHPNTPGAGAAGNMLVSGHQALGDALLAPLALGEIVDGQEILVEDADGRVFVYQISEITAPIPLTGASEEEMAQIDALVASGPTAQLTVITGWPDFTTTHRVLAQAELIGEAAP